MKKEKAKTKKKSPSVKPVLRAVGRESKGFGLSYKLIWTDKRLHIYSKAIYHYLCSYAGAGTTAFPSVAAITKHLGISKDTYKKYMQELIKYEFVLVEQGKKDNGRWSSNTYTLNPVVNVVMWEDSEIDENM